MRNPYRTTMAIGVTALVASALFVGFGSAAEARQRQLPDGLVNGVARDLGISREQAATRLDNQREAQRAVAALPDNEGYWLDESGKLVVAVATDSAAAAVRATGARVERVERDREQLASLSDAVARLSDASGINSWGVDPAANTVTVQVDRSEAADDLTADLEKLGAGVSVVAVGSAPRQQDGRVRTGDPWWPGWESNCSAGFAATDSGGDKHFLTAGHCTNDSDQEAYGESFQGNRIGTSNVGGSHSVNATEGDMGVVAVTEPGWELSAEVNTWGDEPVTVSGSTEPIVGQAVCHSGNTSKWQCGEVRRVNQTIDYGSVVIEDLSTTSACSKGGDSGGGWLAGDQAVGLHSGGPSQCVSDPGPDEESVFQPVNEPLTKWGLSLVTG